MTTTAEFHLVVVTPAGVLEDQQVRSVRFRGLDGEYGILARHAPLVTATEPGIVMIENADGSREELVVTQGFAEVRDNTLTLVCEAGEKAAEIDVARARAAEQAARDLLAHRSTLADADVLKAETALRRALTRLLAAQHAGGSVDRR